jgi:hypothetical protein
MAVAADMYRLDEKGFIRDWLIGGAYPNYQINGKQYGYEDDFLQSLGGEACAEPYQGLLDQAEFKADKSKLIAGIGSVNEWGYTETKTFPVTWRSVHWIQAKPEIVLDKMFLPVDDYIVAYAFCYMESPTAQKIKVRIGSDDDHKVWLNGKLLGGVNKSQGVIPDNFIYDAELQRGLNRLLLKVVDRTHGYGFCLALSDRENRPLRDVTIMTDDPKRQQLAVTPGLKQVDCWDHGYYAGVDFGTKTLFVGANRLNLQVGAPQAGKYEFSLMVENDGRMVVTEKKSFELKESQAVNWLIPMTLPTGSCTMTLKVSGAGEAVLSKRFDVFDPAAVMKETEVLKKQLVTLTSKMIVVRSESEKIKAKNEYLRQRREQLYSEIEDAYAANRAKLHSSPQPIDEAVRPAVTARSRICLNGDVWLMADGKNANGYNPPAADQWRAGSLPMLGFNEYFRTRYFPIVKVDPKNDYGKIKSTEGWEDFQFNPLICAPRLWLRRDIELDASAAGKMWNLVCENVAGKLTVYFNGLHCGEYVGNIGIVNIPLHGIVSGKNRIELYVEKPVQDIPPNHNDTWGMRGDLYLDSAAPAHVADIEVKTRWRKATLEVISELENNGKTPVKVDLDQYCVLNGRIKYRLPAQNTLLAVGEKIKLRTQGIWKEAEPWGIGGKYGKPALYNLVSDLCSDGKLIDRQVTLFGFREFWIAGTDFYLNGKRIILQGETGGVGGNNVKKNEVFFPLLRDDGINTLRNHDADYWSVNFLRSCDRMGMLAYVQMYPILYEKEQGSNFKSGTRLQYLSYEDWLKHPLHQYNLRNYERWVKMLRNHPSVVIASTDNEIFTQAWDTLEREDYNIRNDRLGAFYGKYVKSLNPSLVITRDGDEGTWGHKGKWREDPPCDTANYHYPDFNVKDWVLNWQSVYDFRPVIFGETLYTSYGAWDKWIGPIPSQVAKKAAVVRSVASLYRHLGIPGQIYMGLAHDGFVGLDNTGNGNPWKITADMHKKTFATATLRYPWAKIDWPSQSGSGIKRPAQNIKPLFGKDEINWFDPNVPSHVRNAVNDAYRDCLIPQPQLEVSTEGECIIELGATGGGKVVTAIPVDGITTAHAVTAAVDGTAWFQLPHSGKYRFECDGAGMVIDVPGRADYAAKPGFKSIPRYSFKSQIRK